MIDRSFLSWPFFDDVHRRLADAVEQWATDNTGHIDHENVDDACRVLVARLGEAGLLQHTAVDPAAGGKLDVRSLCIIRETLARHDGLADFAFAMQGLGTGALSLFGTDAQKREWLTRTRAGKALSAFALSEPQSGSDVANLELSAVRDGTDLSSTAKRPGFPTAASPMSIRCLPAPAKGRVPRAFLPSSCPQIRRA